MFFLFRQCLKDLKMYISMTPNREQGLVATIKYVVTSVMKVLYDSRVLHSKQDKESDHQTEQSHGFRQGKSQDGI